MVAGVARGLAEYAGCDPIIPRVAFAVLTLFGGVGALLYILGWLLLPEQGGRSLAASLRGGQGLGARPAEGIALLVAGIAIAVWLVDNSSSDVPLLVVLAGAGFLLYRHLAGRPDRGTTAPPTAVGGPSAGDATGTPTGTASAGTMPPGAASETSDPSVWPLPADITTDLYDDLPATSATPPPPEPRRRTGLVTLWAAILAVGLTGLLQAVGALPHDARIDLTVALVVVALGLVAGSWLGRPRGMIALGVLLSLLLVGTNSAYRVADHRTTWTPTSVGQLHSYYRVPAGTGTLNLSKMKLGGTSRDVRLQVWAGTAKVILPPNLDVAVDAKLGAGKYDVLGTSGDGTTIEKRVTSDGPDGPGGGRLNLDVEVGAGNVEVHRGA